ncbi:MAG: Crp/Fnr family transcriptional regulator [Alphaproteobacteria bacterium]|nr:Crp/Fnr family transcriptional regulator [Alphaproteobacteria bacterium]
MTGESARTLANVFLFKDLSEEDRARVEARCRWRDFAPQEQIIDFQDDSQDVYFITRGVARVVNYSISGREIAFDDLKEGAVFGELAAVDGEPRSANVVAVAPTTVGLMHPQTFRSVLEEHPEIAFTLMKRLTQMVRMSVERIMDLSTLGANNRVYAELLRLAKPTVQDDGTAKIDPIPIHSELASRVSTTRETVARVLSDLSRKGLVKRAGNVLQLTDTNRLRDMVEQFRGD